MSQQNVIARNDAASNVANNKNSCRRNVVEQNVTFLTTKILSAQKHM